MTTEITTDLYTSAATYMVIATERGDYQTAMTLKDELKSEIEARGCTFNASVLFTLCAEIEAERKSK